MALLPKPQGKTKRSARHLVDQKNSLTRRTATLPGAFPLHHSRKPIIAKSPPATSPPSLTRDSQCAACPVGPATEILSTTLLARGGLLQVKLAVAVVLAAWRCLRLVKEKSELEN